MKAKKETTNLVCPYYFQILFIPNWSLLLRIGYFVQMMETCHHENFEKTQFQNKSRECQVLDTLTFTKVGFLDKILSLQETYCLQCLQTATSRNKFT